MEKGEGVWIGQPGRGTIVICYEASGGLSGGKSVGGVYGCDNAVGCDAFKGGLKSAA